MKTWILKLLSGLLLLGAGFSCSEDTKEPPNILFIMSDDHCERAIGVYNSRLSVLDPTPNLDRLANQGMVFDNVFCTNSICTPSRATIMTGQYSHVNKVYDLYDILSEDRNYLSMEMKKAGYTTAVIGKWHLKSTPRYFDYFAVLPGQGKYFDPVLIVSEGGEEKEVRFDSSLSGLRNTIQGKGHSSDVLTDLTLDWLENKRDKTKPFFLMHHFKAPHDMFEYHPRYENYLADVEIPEPLNLYDQPGEHFGSTATRGVNDELIDVIGATVSPQPKKRNLSAHYRSEIIQLTGKENPGMKEMTHYAYQLYVKDYLRCVKGIDDNLGRIIEYLKANDLFDNTIIMYTGDQGIFLGEHDFIDKRWMYEESMQMPFIARYPGMSATGKRNDWLINNTDFAPTMLDLAGVKKPAYMQGESFVAALNGEEEPENWRKATYYRYWMHMAHRMGNPAHFGIRTKKYKLIFFYGTDYTNIHKGKEVLDKQGNRYYDDTPVDWEFYDLQNDPDEMFNQYSNPDYQDIITDLKQLLRQTRTEIGDTDDAFPEIREIIQKNWE